MEQNVIRENRIIYSRAVEGERAELEFTDMDLAPGQEAYYCVGVITRGKLYCVNNAVCTPARGSLLTRRYPYCHDPYRNDIELNRDEIASPNS